MEGVDTETNMWVACSKNLVVKGKMEIVDKVEQICMFIFYKLV